MNCKFDRIFSAVYVLFLFIQLCSHYLFLWRYIGVMQRRHCCCSRRAHRAHRAHCAHRAHRAHRGVLLAAYGPPPLEVPRRAPGARACTCYTVGYLFRHVSYCCESSHSNRSTEGHRQAAPPPRHTASARGGGGNIHPTFGNIPAPAGNSPAKGRQYPRRAGNITKPAGNIPASAGNVPDGRGNIPAGR